MNIIQMNHHEPRIVISLSRNYVCRACAEPIEKVAAQLQNAKAAAVADERDAFELVRDRRGGFLH